MARNEESGTGEARIKKEECGEFVSFLSPFSYSRTHLPTPSALLFLHRLRTHLLLDPPPHGLRSPRTPAST